MSLPEHIVNHKPLADAPEVEEGKPDTPSKFYTVLKSLVEERNFCRIAVSTRNEPSTGRPLRRGDHPRYQTRLEEAQASIEARLEIYAARYGEEAAAEMRAFVQADEAKGVKQPDADADKAPPEAPPPPAAA